MATTRPADGGWTRRGLGVSLPSPIVLRPHVVRDVLDEHPTMPGRVYHDDVIEALASDRTEDPLHICVLPGRSRRRSYLLDVHPFEGSRDVRKDRIAIVQETGAPRSPEGRFAVAVPSMLLLDAR
jgi:hypothetical protein